MPGPSITITNNTNVTHLQEFADKLGANDHLHAKEKNGVVTLYVRSSTPSLWSRITGDAITKRERAKAEVARVLDNTERNLGGAVLDDARKALKTGMSTKGLRGDALRALSDSAASSAVAVVERQKTDEDSGEVIREHRTVAVMQNRGPGLNKLPAATQKILLGDIAYRLNNLPRAQRDDPAAIANAIEGALADQLKTLAESSRKELDRLNALPGLSGEELKRLKAVPEANLKALDRLVLSSGSALKYDLRKVLGDAFPALAGEGGRKILDKAFDGAMLQRMPFTENSNNKIMLNGLQLKRQDRELGAGAYGKVLHYTAPGPDGRSVNIAVKTFQPPALDLSGCDTAAKVDAAKEKHEKMVAAMSAEFKHEAAVHRAMSKGSSNVVGFHGMVRMADGTMGIAMEFVPKGTGFKLREGLEKAVLNQWITPAEKRLITLTFLHDVAKGVGEIHTRGEADRAFFHGDSDLRNYFIDEGGEGKLGDFGLSGKIAKYDISGAHLPSFSQQLGPELAPVHRHEVDVSERHNSGENGVDHTATINSRFSNLSEGDRNKLLSNANTSSRINDQRAGQDVSGVNLRAAETWSFGQAAFSMVYDRPLVRNDAAFYDMQRYVKHGRSAINSQAIDIDPNIVGPQAKLVAEERWQRGEHGFAGTSGDTDLDSFFNRVLHSDPNQRMKPEEIRNHQAFGKEGVGTAETRRLLLAVLEASSEPNPQVGNTPQVITDARNPPAVAAQPAPQAAPVVANAPAANPVGANEV